MHYDPADEEVVQERMGHPYSVLPRGYPNKIRNQKIEETIEKLLENLKNNAGIESIVNKDTALINLGLNELNNRTSRKESRIAFWLAVISIIFAGASFVISVLSFVESLHLNW